MIRLYSLPALLCFSCLAYGDVYIYEQPAFNYTLHCAGCHLATGEGLAPDVPSFRGRLGDMAKVPEGRAYLVQVPGAANAPLSDEELAGVLNWMLGRFGKGTTSGAFVPYDAEEVGLYRQVETTDASLRRQRVLCRLERLACPDRTASNGMP